MKKTYKLYQREPFASFREAIEKNIKNLGDKPGFLYREKDGIKTVSYSEFLNESSCLGNSLDEMGLLGEHVACMGENCYRWIVVFFTMLHSNGVFVPVDRQLPQKDVVNVLTHSDAKVLFYTKKFKSTIEAIKDELPGIKHFICLDDNTESVSYDSLIAGGKNLIENGCNTYDAIKTDENALRVLIYTSGTTGMSKGVMLTQRSIVQDVYHGLRLTRLYDSAISILPYHHVYEAAGLLAEMACHVTIGINDNIKNIMKNFADYKPDSAYLVPAYLEVFYKKIQKSLSGKKALIALMMGICKLLRTVGIDVRRKMFAPILKPFGSNLRKIVSGGAPIRGEIADFFENIGITVVNGYGISECSPLISITRENFDDCHSAGVPVPTTEVRIKDPDTAGVGEICVKGAHVMLGYYKNEEETARVIKDGWFNTEDLGYIDSQGRIHVTGRSKNLIVLKNGKNVFPEEIEEYIQSISYVSEVAVTSCKNEDGQETGLCAHIYIDPTTGEAKDPKIQKLIRRDIDEVTKALPKYKKITKINLRDKEFSKTTSNKIKRNEIDN